MDRDDARLYLAGKPNERLLHKPTGWIFWMQPSGEIFRETSPGYSGLGHLPDGIYEKYNKRTHCRVCHRRLGQDT